MKAIVAVLALLVISSPALANPWEVEGGYAGWWNGDGDWRVEEGYGPYRQDRGYKGHPTLFGGYEEEIWDGNCKIERKWEGDGDYREERHCHGQ
jgi:hypothetical protein